MGALPIIYDTKKQKDELQSVMVSRGSVKDLSKWQTLEEHKYRSMNKKITLRT